MPLKLLKYKNYDIHSFATATADGRRNANIVIWSMPVSMGGKMLCIALYKVDYTPELVRQSEVLNLNLLAEDQTALITKLGRKSGRQNDKLKRLAYAFDERGYSYLTEAVSYVQCRGDSYTEGGDHKIVICEVLKQKVHHPDKRVLTHHFLMEKGLVKG